MARQIIPNSGLWSSIAAIINANDAELYNEVKVGVYDYNDLATATTPISIAVAGTYYPLTNDALGAFTNLTYALPGVPNLWDTITQSFDFTDLALGDTVDIRLDITVTSSANNQDFTVTLFLADGTGGQYELPLISERNFKVAGTRQLVEFTGIYMGDTNTLNNPARFKIKSSNTGSVIVNGWYVRAIKRVLA